jgi:hypothetical protein
MKLVGSTVALSGFCMLLFGMTASASPVFTITGGSLTLTRLISGVNELDDVRGLVSLGIANPDPLDSVVLADSVGGTDPGFVTLPFGNGTINGIGGGEQITITFNFSSQVVTPGTDTITAIGTAFIPDPTTDPGLLALEESPMLFTFQLANVQPGGDTTIASYNLAAVDTVVPEPATAGVFVLGLAAIGLALRKGKRLA